MDNSGHEKEPPALAGTSNGRPLYLVHIALQGCIKSGDINYGLTADTGGHIRYLLEEVRALQQAGVNQSVVTRAFADANLGREYQQQSEILMPGVTLHRLRGQCPGYLCKEDMHCDLDALTDALALWLQKLPRLPDVLHAHYADAGLLALRMRERLGIPFIFTAHSLGAVKARWLESVPGHSVAAPALKQRMAVEQRVIDCADLIVASSEDEATNQYGLYSRTDCARPIRINPPGCDLKRFGEPAMRGRVVASLRRFLADPDKPILLCLARPVRKKNIIGVIDAYARDPALRARANLVIFAGTRGDIQDQEGECAEVLQAIVDRIEHYDLYGSVAFPKQHLADDVPAIYQHAARSGGLFINAAFNEPFGLTFIEAAAAGLPIIASCNGGAQDILSRCQNGILIDPENSSAITCAAHDLLDDRKRWSRCARGGKDAVRYYSWQRHARQYLRDCSMLTSPPRRHLPLMAHASPRPSLIRLASRSSSLLVTDMDDTLLGDAAALLEFTEWLKHNRQLRYAVATGRSAAAAFAELLSWHAPLPDVLISSVGAEIHWAPIAPRYKVRYIDKVDRMRADAGWAEQLSARWRRDACAAVLARCPLLRKQPAEAQGRNKLSYFTDAGPNVVPLVREQLARAQLIAQVVYSHDHFIDVLAPGGAKGGAAEHVARCLEIPAARVVGAGNSGNDLDLLRRTAYGIAVANRDTDLQALAPLPSVYFSRAPHAAGLVEGMCYWQGGASPSVKTG
ncbi:HAD family hydrolase [Salinisphaera aquimarina]|uniref:sucrose-phosphate synthase n=1 Tax=Salinisphaera aquimarina TaxID=2094031 RepID=A0ABV7EPR9_9GAMM